MQPREPSHLSELLCHWAARLRAAVPWSFPKPQTPKTLNPKPQNPKLQTPQLQTPKPQTLNPDSGHVETAPTRYRIDANTLKAKS